MLSPSPENYWRGVILFGRNDSTYKMALGSLLLDYSYRGEDVVTLEDLTQDFMNLYVTRTENGRPQQGKQGRKTLVEHEIDAIQQRGKNTEAALSRIKNEALSRMVLRRFNNLFGHEIPRAFYTFEPGDKQIVLSKDLLQLCETNETRSVLQQEISGRWDLLEHAYERTHITPLETDDRLFYIRNAEDRKNLTPLAPLLSGYQQGRCFYCGEPLYDTHVDHVIPYSAVMHNNVWNLVLAHGECNEQKLDTLPSWAFLEKLIKRNEYYISSSHPLKDEIIRELGNTPVCRRQEVKRQYDDAYRYKRRYWKGDPHYDPSKDNDYLYWLKYYDPNLR